ncbi:hypothetical protein MRY87_10245 [bacterium]|nr:hypothetical protein [bacterium]
MSLGQEPERNRFEARSQSLQEQCLAADGDTAALWNRLMGELSREERELMATPNAGLQDVAKLVTSPWESPKGAFLAAMLVQRMKGADPDHRQERESSALTLLKDGKTRALQRHYLSLTLQDPTPETRSALCALLEDPDFGDYAVVALRGDFSEEVMTALQELCVSAHPQRQHRGMSSLLGCSREEIAERIPILLLGKERDQANWQDYFDDLTSLPPYVMDEDYQAVLRTLPFAHEVYRGCEEESPIAWASSDGNHLISYEESILQGNHLHAALVLRYEGVTEELAPDSYQEGLGGLLACDLARGLLGRHAAELDAKERRYRTALSFPSVTVPDVLPVEITGDDPKRAMALSQLEDLPVTVEDLLQTSSPGREIGRTRIDTLCGGREPARTGLGPLLEVALDPQEPRIQRFSAAQLLRQANVVLENDALRADYHRTALLPFLEEYRDPFAKHCVAHAVTEVTDEQVITELTKLFFQEGVGDYAAYALRGCQQHPLVKDTLLKGIRSTDTATVERAVLASYHLADPEFVSSVRQHDVFRRLCGIISETRLKRFLPESWQKLGEDERAQEAIAACVRYGRNDRDDWRNFLSTVQFPLPIASELYGECGGDGLLTILSPGQGQIGLRRDEETGELHLYLRSHGENHTRPLPLNRNVALHAHALVEQMFLGYLDQLPG